MVVIIDNYDSFTYNLARYFEELECDVNVIKNDAISLQALTKINFNYLVISPGPCTPDQSGISIPAINHFFGQRPILGVCLGHQALVQARGGNVSRAKFIRHGKVSRIYTESGSTLFSECPEYFSATRYHSLLVSREDLPSNYRVTAWCKEFGVDEIMAIEDSENRAYGVQFHPESLLTEHGHQMLKNFLLNG